MGKVGFSPIIGLAVVVALALAAVFGSMSLANPAMAAIGQPADAELTERADSPQQAPANFVITAAPGSDEVVVSWVAVQGANTYRLIYRAVGAPAWETPAVATSPHTVPSLTNDTEYEFQVQALDNFGGSIGTSMVAKATPSASFAPPGAAPGAVSATGGGRQIVVTWTYTQGTPPATGFEYAASNAAGGIVAADWKPITGITNLEATTPPHSYTIRPLPEGTGYNVNVRAVNDGRSGATSTGSPDTGIDVMAGVVPNDATFEADDLEPGKNSWYTLNFNIDKVFNGGIDTMTIKLEGFGVPSSINTGSIALEVTEPAGTLDGALPTGADGIESFTFNPASVAVDGKEITLTMPDVRPEAEHTKKNFDMGTNFRIVIYQNAGVTNPTKSNYYGGVQGTTANNAKYTMSGNKPAHEDREIIVSFTGDGPTKMYPTRKAGDDEVQAMIGGGVYVPRLVQLDENDGGLGTDVMATALGFEKGVTVHFFVDKLRRVMKADGSYVTADAASVKAYNDMMMGGDVGIPAKEDGSALHDVMMNSVNYAMAPNGTLDAGEDVVCSDASSETVASCPFKITSPTFGQGINYINARDGDGNHAFNSINDDQKFEVKPSITVTPDGGSPGEILQVQLHSFPVGAITKVLLHGAAICEPGVNTSCGRFGDSSVGSDGTATLSVPIPNWAVEGIQELKVEASDEDDNTTVTIAGPRVNPTPQTVVANQRISLVGTGFSPNSKLGDDTEESRDNSRISIGGYDIPWTKVNDGRDVDVDDGGNWSASVDLPLVEATTGTGARKLRITDSGDRTGSVDLTIAERNFDITPAAGRVGTLAVVRGTGYPSKNDEGHSFTVDVTYKVGERSSTRVSVVPDASGRFEVQLRIPTTAAIPSTNQVEVSFSHEAGSTNVTEVKQHMVPEGIIELSQTSGGPGSTISLHGEGFKSFVPVESVKIGTIEITPSPKPSTDGNGMMDFDVLIPGLDVGIQTVEVQVGGTTSSTGFTVTESGVNPGDIKEVAPALGDLGDNFVNIWHFNNDTKAWSFYDGMEGSDLTHLITGETYLLQIKSTVEVILNGDTRTLTCKDGNCWNQIVW